MHPHIAIHFARLVIDERQRAASAKWPSVRTVRHSRLSPALPAGRD